jgi:aspartokinase
MLVMKFGGTSVGDAMRFVGVSRLIQDARGGDEQVIVPKTFTALGKHRTKVISIAQASSEYNVSFVVTEDQGDSTVCLIHEELGLGNSSAPQL